MRYLEINLTQMCENFAEKMHKILMKVIKENLKMDK